MVSKSQLRDKLKTLTTYAGVFIGVGLIAFNLEDGGILLTLLGLVLSTLAMLTVFKMTSSIQAPKISVNKQMVSYGFSSLGIGASLGSWFFLDRGVVFFLIFFGSGVVISFSSRYNFRKQKPMAIVEDYLMHLIALGGVSWMAWGLLHGFEGSTASFILVPVGAFLSPTILFLRDSAIFRHKGIKTWRKFFSLLAVLLGLGFILAALVGFTSQSVATLLGSSLLTDIVFFCYGLLITLGGTFLYDGRYLVSIKDLL